MQGRLIEVTGLGKGFLWLHLLLLFAMLGCGSGTQPAKPSVESGGNQAQQEDVKTAVPFQEHTVVVSLGFKKASFTEANGK